MLSSSFHVCCLVYYNLCSDLLQNTSKVIIMFYNKLQHDLILRIFSPKKKSSEKLSSLDEDSFSISCSGKPLCLGQRTLPRSEHSGRLVTLLKMKGNLILSRHMVRMFSLAKLCMSTNIISTIRKKEYNKTNISTMQPYYKLPR